MRIYTCISFGLFIIIHIMETFSSYSWHQFKLKDLSEMGEIAQSLS